MAVTQMARVNLSDFAECVAHILEDQVDPYALLPTRTFGNPIVQPGRLVIRGFFDINTSRLLLYTLNFETLYIDLTQCVEYVDTDGPADYILDSGELEVTTPNGDIFILRIENY